MRHNKQRSSVQSFVRSVVIVVGLAVPLYMLLEYTPIDVFVNSVKEQQSLKVASNISEVSERDADREELLSRIRLEAEQLYEAPINAKIDPVWKAIPGYNGIEVDIEKTVAVNQDKPKGADLTYIFREVEPQIKLEDLGAQPIYKGNPKKKMVGFMINVAWGDEFLPGMLATLKEQEVAATFFFDGSWLRKNVETARKICEAGFECSNHAYSHPNMSELSRHKQLEEITKTERLLSEELRIDNKWFAPPSGDYNQLTVDVAHEQGLHTVLWTIDTVDWKKPEPAWIVRRISANLEPGSLILMHPTSSSSQALQDMIRVVREAGYAFGTVSEVLSTDRIVDIETAIDF